MLVGKHICVEMASSEDVAEELGNLVRPAVTGSENQAIESLH